MVSPDGDPDAVEEVVAGTRRTRYGTGASRPDHLGARAATAPALAVAVATVVAVRSGDPRVAAVAAVAVAIRWRSSATCALVVVLCVVGALRSQAEWRGVQPDSLGAHTGWVRVVDDPQPFRSSTRVVVEVEGERFESWARGRGSRAVVGRWRAGERVVVSGERTRLDERRASRVAWQHVVGEMRIDWVGDSAPGGAVARASNRVRSAIERAGDALGDPEGALFRGLVVGDDRDQPPEMVERFRASGLSHLTAVSGQNVSFLLAATGPVLRRLRPWARWVVTIGLIAWFVALTRFEPSIVRAGVMASLSATAFVLGRERDPVRTLAVAVVVLVLVDPLIVWSVGFWLSVGATLGVSGPGPWIARRWSRLGALALPLGVTLGAQIGVAIPSVLVFGRLPLVSIPANLLAVPVAGAVMLYGMPAGLVAGWIPAVAPAVVFPARLGTRWVDAVALIGARLEPGPTGQVVGWVLITVVSVVALAICCDTRGSNGDLPRDR